MAAMMVHLTGPGGEAPQNFLAELCRELDALGLGVAVARQEADPAPLPDCGAAELRLGAQGLSLRNPGGAPPLEEALRLLKSVDLVISLLPPEEGRPVVEYCPAGAGPGLLGRAGLVALTGPGDFPDDAEVPVLGDTASLAGFLASRTNSHQVRRSLSILADGKPIKAKPFVKDIIANSLHGLLAPLKGTEGARRLEIIIEE